MKGIEFLLLGLGALTGAFLRYKMAESPVLLGMLPINILIINVVGSFILGMFVVISIHLNFDPRYSVFIVIGFCGSFTTMSSFALQSVSLIDSKHFVLFGLNLIGNVGLSILALVAGRMIIMAVFKP